MLKFPKLLVNHVKALAAPNQANCLLEQTRVILFDVTSVYVYVQPLFEPSQVLIDSYARYKLHRIYICNPNDTLYFYRILIFSKENTKPLYIKRIANHII